MKSIAAVCRAAGARFDLEELELPELRPRDVLVRVSGVGICPTDLASRDGLLGAPFPSVFGHEGSGIVEQVGCDVTKLAPGDPVVLAPASDGTCVHCAAGRPMYCDAFDALNFQSAPGAMSAKLADGQSARLKYFGQSSFAQFALASERNAIKVTSDAPLVILGPLGCSIQTGAGTVMNGLKPAPGTRLAILGADAVGLAALMGAVLCGCERIVVADRSDSRLELALSLGATHVIHTGRTADLGTELQRIAPGGVDYLVDCCGTASQVASALPGLARLGRVALVASPRPLARKLPLPWASMLHQGQTVQGFVEGDSVPEVFIPRLVALHLAGRFPFNRLLTLYAFDAINLAVEDQLAGRTIKAVLEM